MRVKNTISCSLYVLLSLLLPGCGGCNRTDPREERLDEIKQKIDSDKPQDNIDAADKAIKEFGGQK